MLERRENVGTVCCCGCCDAAGCSTTFDPGLGDAVLRTHVVLLLVVTEAARGGGFVVVHVEIQLAGILQQGLQSAHFLLGKQDGLLIFTTAAAAAALLLRMSSPLLVLSRKSGWLCGGGMHSSCSSEGAPPNPKRCIWWRSIWLAVEEEEATGDMVLI